jgi:NADH:ubiquinone oxidoreductase subunit C
MTEVPEQPKPAPPAAPAAGRTVDEIKRDPLVARACERAGDAIIEAKEFAGEISLTVTRDRIAEVAQVFKNEGFNYLVDLAGVDYSNFPAWIGDRFGVSYTLYSFSKNNRVRLKVTTDENTPIPTVTSVWKTANWHERETFDMLGITFSDHPNLERILMWDRLPGRAITNQRRELRDVRRDVSALDRHLNHGRMKP